MEEQDSLKVEVEGSTPSGPTMIQFRIRKRKKKMNKLIAIFLMCVLTAGCASTSSTSWWTNFQNDPVAQTQIIINTAQTVASVAALAFAQVKPNLSPADQITAQATFDKAMATLNHAEGALQAGVMAAVDAQDSTKLQALINDVLNAVQSIQAIIADLKAKSGVTGVGAQSELDWHVSILKAQAKRAQ